MSHTTNVSLKDGSTISREAYDMVYGTLKLARNKSPAAFTVAFYDLVKRCKNPEFKFATNPIVASEAFLRSYKLLDSNGSISENVKKITLNSFEKTQLGYKLVDPILVKRRCYCVIL